MYDEEALNKITQNAKQKLAQYADVYDEYEEETTDSEEDSNKIPQKIKPDYRYTAPIADEDIDYHRNEESLAEDEIFQGGPSIHEVNKWKQEYGDCLIFVTEIAGEMFVCRTISRPEYRALVTKYDLDQLQREDLICTTCTLFPYNFTWEDLTRLRGGIPSTLASVIMKHSGFTEEYGVQVL